MNAQRLLALQASDGATVTLERYPIVLGRSLPGGSVPDVDVSHLDPNEAVDSRHCELVRDPNGLEVHDLGALSGTWVQGRRLPAGGRALLELGGTLRVAGVTMTLIDSPNQPLAPPVSPSPSRSVPPPAGWRESGPADAVPPPPSAGGWIADEEPREPERRSAALDLSGAPLVAREPIERGALAVRIRPGSSLETFSGGSWAQVGQQLSDSAVSDAVATVRRALGLPEDALSGDGWAGDVALEFLLPPLTGRPHLLVRVEPRAPAELDQGDLEQAWRIVAGGGALLVAGPRPDLALAALLERIDREAWGTSVLNFGSSDWWVPPGWPSLDPQHPDTIRTALTGGPLVLVQPPEPVLNELLSILPRPGGGTVISLSARSLPSALELLARQLGPARPATATSWQREEVSRLFTLALAWRSSGWRSLRVGLDPQGRWTEETALDRGEQV
jgi:hypothetical protein